MSASMARIKYGNEVEHLGSDQIWEIFSRMPAKSALKLLSLSKTLSSIPSNPAFAERQSIYSSNFDGGFFLQPYNQLLTPALKLEFHVLSRNTDRDSPSTFGIPPESLSFLHLHLHPNGHILTSNQGLVVLHRFLETSFLICNPATRSFSLVPTPPSPLGGTFGILLEFHPTNLKTHSTAANYFPNDYTILFSNSYCINNFEKGELGTPVVCLTLYRNGKWEDTLDLSIPERLIEETDMAVALWRGCNGGIVVHYLCERHYCLEKTGSDTDDTTLVAYDVDKKAFTRTFSLPEGTGKEVVLASRESFRLRIFKWGSWGGGKDTIGLLLSDQRTVRVWVLEEYEQGGWRRLMSKTAAEMGVAEEEGSVMCCDVIKGGTELVLATERRVYVYQMEGPHTGRLEAVAEHRCQAATALRIKWYANTLRPVCSGETGVVKF